MSITKFIQFINHLFTNDIDNNKNLLVNNVIPYLYDNDYTIDDVIELLNKCPELLETIKLIIESKSKLISEDSILYIAYTAIFNAEEEAEKSPLTYYFENKIGDINFLTVYMLDILKYKFLTREEIKQLFMKYEVASGDEKDAIAHEIINSNLALVVSIAKKYLWYGIDYLDLIQEGNIGLCIAVSKYNYKKGYAFTTYATWWIRREIMKSIIYKARTIRIPHYMIERMRNLRKAEEYLKSQDEYSLNKLSELSGFSVDEIYEMRKYGASIVSLDMQIVTQDFDDDTTLGDMIPFYDTNLDNLINKLSFEKIRQVVLSCESLSVKERKIIDLRYGLTDGKSRTLEEVGNEMYLTYQAIEYYQCKIYKKLKAYLGRNGYNIHELLEEGNDNSVLTLK